MPTPRKIVEIFMALYVFGFGAYVDLVSLPGKNALGWLGFSELQTHIFAWACVFVATIHAFGIWLNGSLWWSPLIRIGALVVGAGLLSCLAVNGVTNLSTAGYTYGWVSVGFAIALYTAVLDTRITWILKHGNRTDK